MYLTIKEKLINGINKFSSIKTSSKPMAKKMDRKATDQEKTSASKIYQ